jgi:predicted permease
LAAVTLPFFFLALCTILALIFFVLAGFVWKDATRNLAAFATADGNTGYFGIPVALALFGERSLSYIVLGSIGFVLYENTVGYFILARSNSSVRESVRKVLRLPTIFAFIAGLLFQLTPFDIPDALRGGILNVRGAYSMLGMMMIGLGLAGLRLNELDGKLFAFTSLGKFIVWPLVMFGIIAFDVRFLHVYGTEVHQVMLLLSMVPLAANTVALSTLANVHPQKAAMAVLASTIVALFFIPAMAGMFLL